MTPVYDHVWFWKVRPVDLVTGIITNRKGHPCRVVARGAMNSIDVEFADGTRVITSRYAVRRAGP